MSLPIKVLHIDSHTKTVDSISNSNFKIELPEVLLFPKDTIYYIDSVTIPHTWYTIEANVNDKLYMQVTDNTTNIPLKTNICKIIVLEPGNYNITSLASEILIKANTSFSSSSIPHHFSIIANVYNNTISITPQTTTMMVKILTDSDILDGLSNISYWDSPGGWDGSWSGASYNPSNPHDINDILNNTEGRASFFTQSNAYRSGYVDLQPIKNVFLTSTNLSNFHTLGPNGERIILKKIPVNAGNNEMIFYNTSLDSDCLDCSRKTLKTIEFQLKDIRGNIIPLHGSHVSFTIIFDIKPSY